MLWEPPTGVTEIGSSVGAAHQPITQPILVTGSHRSGTTWVGRLLSFSGEVEVIHEPFNPTLYRSWLSSRPDRWFQYIPAHDSEDMRLEMERVLQLRPPWAAMLRRSESPRMYAGTVREHTRAARARVLRRRPLLKDPLAFFAAEWLWSSFGVLPVVLVRHPAAFASSLKRLDWKFNFRNIWEQPDLVDRHLQPFRSEIEAAPHSEMDVIDRANLLWRMITHVTLEYRRAHPSWLVVRYEDLASEPVPAFEDVYRDLGLTWSGRVVDRIRAFTGSENVAEVAPHDKGGVRRNSREAMWTWTSRLTPEEVRRVRDGTDDIASELYGPDDWVSHRHEVAP